MRGKRLFMLKLASILIAFALLNSGCDLLDTIIRAVGTACASPDITVTRRDDPSGGACTSSDCSLRQAVTLSNICPGTQTIRLPTGTYSLTNAGAGEDRNRTGDLDITDSVNFSGEGNPVIDGNHGDRVFDVKAGATVAISSVDLNHGRVAGDGGGILNNGSLRLTGVSLLGNFADSLGGGLMNNGDATADDLTVLANQAETGGGIYNNGTMTLHIAAIEENLGTGTAHVGGGIRNLGHLEASQATPPSRRALSSTTPTRRWDSGRGSTIQER
jgi:hypothetical protein